MSTVYIKFLTLTLVVSAIVGAHHTDLDDDFLLVEWHHDRVAMASAFDPHLTLNSNSDIDNGLIFPNCFLIDIVNAMSLVVSNATTERCTYSRSTKNTFQFPQHTSSIYLIFSFTGLIKSNHYCLHT